jgi:hypothetical protein
MLLPVEYKVERINKNNYSDFVNIHKEAFESDIGIDFPTKKFHTLSFSGIENIGYIVYNKLGEPVSFYGVYPLFAKINNKKVLIAQSGDTMTKPAYTALGLFISSAALTYNLCKENNIAGVFGFPSPSSFRIFKKKLVWNFKEHLIQYKFRIPTVPVAYFAQKFKFIKTPYLWWVRLIFSFYKKSDFFESSVIRNGQDGIIRDKLFWHYKMNCNDNFALYLNNTATVIKTNGRLSVGDVNIESKTEFGPILRKLKLLSFLTFNTSVVFYISPGTLLDNKLSSIKQGTNVLPIGFLNLSDKFDLSSLKFTYFDLDTF